MGNHPCYPAREALGVAKLDGIVKTMNIPMNRYDTSTITTLRQALDEVLADPRFEQNKFATALEMAEYLLSQAAKGERDLDRLKQLAFDKLAA